MDDFFAEEEDTNPFSKAAAQYIEDHQEEEEEVHLHSREYLV